MQKIFVCLSANVRSMVESACVIDAGIGFRVSGFGVRVERIGAMAARIGVIRVQMGAIHDRIGVIRARIGAIRNPIRARTALLAPLAAVLVLAVVAHPAAAQCERTPAGVKLLASDPSANAYLGAAVAISGNTIVVGSSR